jgi:hypothetical protein
MDEPWQTLGVEPYADKRAIKRAYAKKLKSVRPDDDPEGFQRLRAAYESALEFERASGEVGPTSAGAAPRFRSSDAAASASVDSEEENDPKAPRSTAEDAVAAEAGAARARVDEHVDQLLNSPNPEQLFRATVAEETSLEFSQSLEQRLYDLAHSDRATTPILIAAASHHYGWTQPGGLACDGPYNNRLTLLEGAYEALLTVRRMSTNSDDIDEVITANILLGEARYELEFDHALNSLGSMLQERYGPEWDLFLPGSTTVDAWLEGETYDSPHRDNEFGGGIGCFTMVVLVVGARAIFRAFVSGDIQQIPPSIAIAVALVITGMIVAWAAGRWG